MHTDSRGFQLTTSNGDAAKACALAMDHYLERKSDVTALLKEALDNDPECAIANATMGLMVHGAKNHSYAPKVSSLLESAKKYSSGISAREQLYIQALEHAVDGKLNDTVKCYESILKQSPTDGFALCLCQSELFWLGNMEQSLAVSSSVANHWNDSVAGYSEFLGMYAFDLEEAGQYEKAQNAGQQALALNPSNIWATHAVAHVLYMQGRHKEGVEWIDQWQNDWDGIGQMQFHVWWHKCLFHLEHGEHEAVLEGYDAWVRNPEHDLYQSLPDLYIDLQNGASLLWRLEFAGVDVGSRWEEMAALVTSRVSDVSNPFTSAHFAVILAAVGDYDSCEQLLQAMHEFSKSKGADLSLNYAKAGLPAAEAAIAHRKGEYQRTVDLLYPTRHDLGLMGGSHAQQDLFFQILVDATEKSGDVKMVDSLLKEIELIGFVEPAQLSAYKLISLRTA